MAQLLVRQLDDDVKSALQRRARAHGRSTEEEVREILRHAVRSDEGAPVRLGTAIAKLFRDAGVDADLPEIRGHPVRAADFDDE
ncbi:MAG: toxin-antitoxin system [Actinomycetota bacterium]|jgi:plasmid stability protein|nr:toxin-antitoxin system [Actinomycetota bacterium]